MYLTWSLGSSRMVREKGYPNSRVTASVESFFYEQYKQKIKQPKENGVSP